MRQNEEIKGLSHVVCVNHEGENLGAIPFEEALGIAQDAGLDLVEVAPEAEPPVCRIMDHGNFQFKRKKRQKMTKKQSKTQLKQMNFRAATASGDRDVKLRKVREFLAGGHKVKLVVRFRGREVIHKDLVLQSLRDICGMLEDCAVVELDAEQEGRQFACILAPKKE